MSECAAGYVSECAAGYVSLFSPLQVAVHWSDYDDKNQEFTSHKQPPTKSDYEYVSISIIVACKSALHQLGPSSSCTLYTASDKNYGCEANA